MPSPTAARIKRGRQKQEEMTDITMKAMILERLRDQNFIFIRHLLRLSLKKQTNKKQKTERKNNYIELKYYEV
jgi:hypothetical protein